MLIAHLTDLHIGLDTTMLMGHPGPTMALRRTLAHVGSLDPAPDVLIISGDLSDEGNTEDYITVRDMLREELPDLDKGGPLVLAVPGNHDDAMTARHVLGELIPVAADTPEGRTCLHVEHGLLHFIGLDTAVPNRPHGALDAPQLAWLEVQLDHCAGQPVVIFMHHPPLMTGITAMDTFGLLEGRSRLGELVARHGGVQLIAAGHIHRPIIGLLGGAPVLVAPSVSHQINLDLRPAAPLACRLEPPMIGLYRYSPTTGTACHFSYVDPFPGPFFI